MKRILQRHGRTFTKYAIVGVGGTAIDLGVFTLLIAFTALGATWFGTMIAATLSFVLAVVNNYAWNRRWTFRSTALIRRQFPRFFLVSIGGWALNALFLSVFAALFAATGLFGIVTRNVLAKAGASGVVLLYNFIAHRLWTFR